MKTIKNNITLIGVTVYFLIIGLVALSVASPNNTYKVLLPSDAASVIDEDQIKSSKSKMSAFQGQLHNYKKQVGKINSFTPTANLKVYRAKTDHGNYKKFPMLINDNRESEVIKTILPQNVKSNYKSQF